MPATEFILVTEAISIDIHAHLLQQDCTIQQAVRRFIYRNGSCKYYTVYESDKNKQDFI